jgi:hypothetical protein
VSGSDRIPGGAIYSSGLWRRSAKWISPNARRLARATPGREQYAPDEIEGAVTTAFTE